MTGLSRRNAWRWAVAVWTALVVVAGGLTLWLQDSAEPPPPRGWENANPGPTPPAERLRPTACPTPTAADGVVIALCAVSTG